MQELNCSNKIYIDCTLGVSGNMIIGAFIHMGFPLEVLQEEVNKVLRKDSYRFIVKKLPIPSGEITYFNTEECFLTDNEIEEDKKHIKEIEVHKELALEVHRFIKAHEVIGLLEKSSLKDNIKAITLKAFRLLSEAKAMAHQCHLTEVSFSREGITDTLIDIIGAATALDYYNIKKVSASPLNLGSGRIILPHREMDIPAPMTRILLKGKPCFSNELKGERVTPTGAAIISALADEFILPTEICYYKIGYGAATEEADINGALKIML